MIQIINKHTLMMWYVGSRKLCTTYIHMFLKMCTLNEQIGTISKLLECKYTL